jgi:hypothetical protein
VELWAQTYDHLVQFAYGGFFANCLALDYVSLASNPAVAVSRICAGFGLPSPLFTSDLRPKDWHNIGGNPFTHLDDRYRSEAVVLDEGWKDGLSPTDKARISNDPRVKRTLSSLRSVTVTPEG